MRSEQEVKIMPKVSIVMPLCNQEKYIKPCLKSVMKQTLKDIEIIVVDDGSKDKSLKIVNSLARKDKRIVVISKKNSGYGNTMNVGMDRATGEYIGIVETDDFVRPEMFEVLYNTAKKNDADIVKSDYFTFTTKGGLSKTNSLSYIKTAKDDKYYLPTNVRKNPNIYNYEMNTWTGIYKTSFLRNNNIKHNETPGASYQDNGFWFQTITLAETIVFVNQAFYKYRFDNPNSSINSPGKVFCMCDEYAYIFEFVKNHPELKDVTMKAYFVKKFWNYFYTYNRIADEYKIDFLKRFKEEFETSFDSGDFKFKYFDDWMIGILSRIIDDPEAFYYEDKIFVLEEEIKDLRKKLDEAKGSDAMKIGNKLLKPFKKLLGRE